MRFRRNGFLPCVMAIAIAFIALNGVAHAQLNVSISGPASGTTMSAPTGSFNVSATVSGSTTTNLLTKIVFYRNDVPHKTFFGSSTSQILPQNQLGQDSYTYRARAYDSQGNWADSSDLKLTVETPRFFKMGDSISVPGGTTIPTSGPNPTEDHTDDIRNVIAHLGSGGGTIYFPCSEGLSIYNISDTITIPSNITLQGESSEEGIYYSRCRIYWNTDPIQGGCANPLPTVAKAVFKVQGTTSRVRFRDLWMVSRIFGRDCPTNGSADQIKDQMTTAILLNAQTGGSISDVIFENVSMTGFTYGIEAVGNSISDTR